MSTWMQWNIDGEGCSLRSIEHKEVRSIEDTEMVEEIVDL